MQQMKRDSGERQTRTTGACEHSRSPGVFHLVPRFVRKGILRGPAILVVCPNIHHSEVMFMDQIKHHSGERETRRVGACELTLEQETGEYITMSLRYSDELLLTPNYQDACVLFQALKFALIDKRPVSDYRDFQQAIHSSGISTWWPLQPLLRAGEKTPYCFQISSGPLTYFADPARLRVLYNDMCSAAARFGLDPKQFFSLDNL